MGTPQVRPSLPQAINDFAFKLVAKTGTPSDKNVLISPFSVSSALSMLVPGTAGAEQATLLSVLAPSMSEEQLRSGARDLSRSMLAAPGQPLQIANSAWVQRKLPLNPAFPSSLQDYFGAQIKPFDPTPESTRAINAWVDEMTKQRIHKVIDQIDSRDVLFLVNAIAFDGRWERQFPADRTAPAPFHRTSENVDVPMMRNTGADGFMANDELKAVRLDYEGKSFAMVGLLPNHGDAGQLLRGLNASKLAQVLADMQPSPRLVLGLPKFKFEDQYELAQPLSSMGLGSLFQSADFSPISPELKGAAISRVIHKTFIDVDEAGTKAAAATAVVMTRAVMRDPPSFVADRPFAFLILHQPTNTILFAGVVNDPSKGA